MCPIHGRGLSISKLFIDEATNKLHEKNCGLHMMLIYPDLDTLRRFYCMYTKHDFTKHMGMIVIAPFYETTDSVRSNLSKSFYFLNLVKYENDGILNIVDATKTYPIASGYAGFAADLICTAKTLGKVNITFMQDKGGMFQKGQHTEGITDHTTYFKGYNKYKKYFCLYHEKDIECISSYQLLELFEIHDMIIELVPYVKTKYKTILTVKFNNYLLLIIVIVS